MQRKPVVLILTSSHEPGSAALAEAVRALGTHRASCSTRKSTA